jgi:hypothetical protein
MDILFGTYRCPPREPAALGINEPISLSYFGQLMHPFRTRTTGKVLDVQTDSSTELRSTPPRIRPV